MINRVKLRLFDQAHSVGEFERHGSAGLERRFETVREIINVGYVREHVVSGDEVRPPALTGQPFRQRGREELAGSESSGDAGLASGDFKVRRAVSSCG